MKLLGGNISERKSTKTKNLNLVLNFAKELRMFLEVSLVLNFLSSII